jgi:hypothetical protein
MMDSKKTGGQVIRGVGYFGSAMTPRMTLPKCARKICKRPSGETNPAFRPVASRRSKRRPLEIEEYRDRADAKEKKRGKGL